MEILENNVQYFGGCIPDVHDRVKWLDTRVLQLFGPNLFSRPGSHGLFHPLRVLVDNINYVSPDS